MDNYSSIGTGSQTLAGRVLSLLGTSLVVTALAALAAPMMPGLVFPAMIAALIAVIALIFAKEVPVLNLALFYLASGAFGLMLGAVIETYVARGMGAIVVDAAATTAVITAGAGFYGWTTKRDLSGLGPILFMGLLGLVVASVVGIFVHLTMLSLVIGVVGAVIFTVYIAYDVNRVIEARFGSEGDAIVYALDIYLDIINLFLSILRILGALSGRD